MRVVRRAFAERLSGRKRSEEASGIRVIIVGHDCGPNGGERESLSVENGNWIAGRAEEN
jgi:hypothetical protein